MAIPKKKTEEIIDELSIFGRKNASEFKIHKWKHFVKSIENDDPVEARRLLAIIAVYENDYSLANQYFEQALKLTAYQDSVILNDFAQALDMQGRGVESSQFFLKAFCLEPSHFNFQAFLSRSRSMLYSDIFTEMISILEKYDTDVENSMKLISIYENDIEQNIIFLNEMDVSIESYRQLINVSNIVINKKFYTQSSVDIIQGNDFLTTIIQPRSLSLQDIAELNDDFVEKAIELDLPSSDLLKLPVYFSMRSNDVDSVA